MKIQVKIFLVCSMLPWLISCAPEGKRRTYFSETLNNYIGRSIDDYWLAKPVDVDYEENEIIYYYVNNEIGCKWVLIVSKESKIIKKWKYISKADRCFEQINWLGPW